MADDSKYPNSRPGLSPALGFSNTYRVHQKAGDLTLPFKKITLISEVSDSTKQSRWLSSLYPTFCLLLSFFILHISYSSLAPPTPTLVSHLLRAQCPSLAPWKAALPNSMLSLHLTWTYTPLTTRKTASLWIPIIWLLSSSHFQSCSKLKAGYFFRFLTWYPTSLH